MEGRGVTNFSLEKPSHGFTTKTTEFDDELIKRGIVTMEQAMMAKGASAEEAIRLANEKKKNASQQQQQQQQQQFRVNAGNDKGRDSENDDDSDEDSFDDDDDDAFLQEYRQQRLEQMKQESRAKQSLMSSQFNNNNNILHIRRNEWKQAVNEASAEGWVLVTMIEASGDRKDRVIQELLRFSYECSSSTSNDGDDNDLDGDQNETRHNNKLPSLVTIHVADAIPNWPQERVPALFAYRDGVKQHEWIAERRGEFPPSKILERILRTWKVI